MRIRSILLAAIAVLTLSGCGDAIEEPARPTTPSGAALEAYRLSVHSTQGKTDALRTSVCGTPSTKLVELPCGLSLGFARTSAPRLFVWRGRDRLYLELGSKATAVFTALAEPSGDRGLVRRSSWQQLASSGKRFWIGLNPRNADYPRPDRPTYLSILVVYADEMPVPTPAAPSVPKDATVTGASAEFLVQLATRRKADQP